MKLATKLTDLFSADALAHALAERHVVARKHPTAPLTILNYTERCQYERGLWNDVTINCRGLIHDAEGNIVARPFRKFFNYGQAEAATIDMGARCIASDKLDGSLGILYHDGSAWAIATRGAFESDQAKHATALLRRRYAAFTPPAGWTLLFEIVYPENRIVLDYGERDDLVLLGAVNIETGFTATPDDSGIAWCGPRAEVFPYRTVADALAAPPRQNAEGLVLHLLNTDERVKIKQEDYVALHRIVTGLNERTVWEHLRDGESLDDLLSALPDEFQGWASEVAARLTATVEHHAAEIESAYSAILAALPVGFARKDYALAAKSSPDAGALFARHDGKDFRARLWDQHQPPPRIGPRTLLANADVEATPDFSADTARVVFGQGAT